jgi:hypothetical protein
MPHHKKHEKLEKIKENIENLELSEEEKSNAYKHIEQWYQEDRALSQLAADLAKISQKFYPILEELGLV